MKNKQMKKEELLAIRRSELIQNPVVWTNKNLFQRYCQSQNYYFTRDVNEILADASTKAVVRFKDWASYDDDDEYLKRYYFRDEYPQKTQLLTEYYKFHTDIARIFMEPIATILNKYYDKKRKYEYYRIARLIEEENKKNPSRPPKGIVGERPSPANSQETQKDEESPTAVKRIRNIQILKDLSWLNCSQNDKKKKNDVSCTLQEICKCLGNMAFEQSSFFISNGKTEELKLDKFLSYMNQQVKKSQTKIDQQQILLQSIQNQQKNQHKKKLSQPQEQLIQTLIQQQVKQQQDDSKPRLGSQHSKQNTDLLLQMNKISKEINFNFVKNQVDSIFKSKQSNDNPSSLTRVDQKTTDQIKQSANPKSKTIIQHQPKISTQLFLKDLKKNVQQVPQTTSRQSQHQIQSPTYANQNQKTQTTTTTHTNVGKLNLKQISKLFIEEDPTEQELKWKFGSQTHRPISGTQNFFSNRNSPTISRGAQNDLKLNKLKQQQPQAPQAPQSSKNAKQQSGSQTNRKPSQPNIHIRYTSNQDKVININININDHPEYLKQQQQKHKKNQSEGKTLQQNTPTPDDFVCLTDRGGGQSGFLFKNSVTASLQNSPKTQKLKRVGSGTNSIKNTSTHKNSLIQQMITQVAQQQQKKQDFLSTQFRKPN